MSRASERLRLGLIGLGGAAVQMLPTLIAHPHVRIVACADINVAARERFAADFGVASYENAEALCADPCVDAVYIASPHQLHRSHVIAAAAAGKHIVVEKPMALTLSDCDAIIAAVEQAGSRLVVGHTHSFDRPIMKMREILSSSVLGPLSMINTFSYGNFLYRPRRPEELDTKKGGGIIFNQVPHQLDIVRYLGGGMVRSVRSMAWVLDPARPTEGSHATFLQFEDGAAATIVYSGYDYFDSDVFHDWVGELGEQRTPGENGKARDALRGITAPEEEAALKGSRAYSTAPRIVSPQHHPHCGVTIVSCAKGEMRTMPDGVVVYNDDGKTKLNVPKGPAFPDKATVFDELIDAIERKKEPIRNARWGKATMEASLAILESASHRHEVTLQYQVPVEE